MIGAEERRKLISRFGSDPDDPLIAVLKCLAGVIVLVVVAAGPWVFLATNNPSGADAQTAPRMNAAVAESKRVFDERRRADEAARQSSTLEPVTTVARERLAVD